MVAHERLERILDFLAIADRFKSIDRAVSLQDHSRAESDAEHSWHMALFALVLAGEAAAEVDIGHVLALIAVHDLVEIYAGDAYAHDAEARREKHARELAAADRLFPTLPDDLAARLRGWWDEYEAGETSEAQFARAIDRLQAFAQNVLTGGVVWRQRGVTESISRAYNRDAMALSPVLDRIFQLLYERARQERLWGNDDRQPDGEP